MDEIFDRKNVVLAKSSFDDSVVIKGNALLVHLAVAALVDQLTDRLEIRITRVPLADAYSSGAVRWLTHMRYRAPRDGAFEG